ncbi:hypothetical protein GCM10010310_30210 [Streptomyces violaceolatus]|uniref:Uncharacterized protein n=1 Tax=Streptomyces violaceolatus TaxID=67378 RepID=A0ABN3SNY5_9ACTN
MDGMDEDCEVSEISEAPEALEAPEASMDESARSFGMPGG